MIRIIFTCVLFFLSFFGQSQTLPSIEGDGIRYCGRDFFLLEGTQIPDDQKEGFYDRLPITYKDKVRQEVWNLSKSSAGLSLRFFSNTSIVKVRWTLLKDAKMNHMAETGIKGVDLYCREGKLWQYVNTGRSEGIENKALLVSQMNREWREYKLYLPLYDGLVNIEIGIDSLSEIRKGTVRQDKPIVYYGTSIAQGGCASRPGMAHTNILSRVLEIDCINLGFSGNGRMEIPVGEFMSEINALFYVIDCVPNMNDEMIRDRAAPLVEYLREKRPETPIVLIASLLPEKSFLDVPLKEEVMRKNKAQKEVYQALKKKGIRHLYYIDNPGEKIMGHDGTVDGVHLTDLGFMKFSEYLVSQFVKQKLIIMK